MNEIADWWKPGLVVRLIGDDLPMTVDAIRPDGIIECIWHNRDGNLVRDAFLPETLSLCGSVRITP